MKKILVAACLVLSANAFADVISFECISEELPGVHKFDAHGIVTVDDLNKVEGVATVITEKAGSIHSAQTFDEVRVTGSLKHYKAGEVMKDAFDQLQLTSDADYLKTMNLLLGIKTKIASRLLSVDNFAYRSNCKIIERFF